VQDLALLDELGHSSDGLLDLDVGIDTVLVVEVDVVGAQASQRTLDRAADVVGRAVERAERGQVAGRRRVHPASELRRDHILVPVTLDRASDQFLVGQGSVQLRGVDEVDPELERPLDRRDRLVLVGRAVERGHAHASESEGRDLQIRKFAPLHCRSSLSP
jgi:hypothetical protein